MDDFGERKTLTATPALSRREGLDRTSVQANDATCKDSVLCRDIEVLTWKK
ncbi:MAG: hypothetical protein H7831_07250 [Magnetococcus sp. WYHC-3]